VSEIRKSNHTIPEYPNEKNELNPFSCYQLFHLCDVYEPLPLKNPSRQVHWSAAEIRLIGLIYCLSPNVLVAQAG
jgi:hypothetical protein